MSTARTRRFIQQFHKWRTGRRYTQHFYYEFIWFTMHIRQPVSALMRVDGIVKSWFVTIKCSIDALIHTYVRVRAYDYCVRNCLHVANRPSERRTTTMTMGDGDQCDNVNLLRCWPSNIRVFLSRESKPRWWNDWKCCYAIGFFKFRFKWTSMRYDTIVSATERGGYGKALADTRNENHEWNSNCRRSTRLLLIFFFLADSSRLTAGANIV